MPGIPERSSRETSLARWRFAALCASLIALLAGALVALLPAIELIDPERVLLPPHRPEALWDPPPRHRLLRASPALVASARMAARIPDVLKRLGVLCQSLRRAMPGLPAYPEGERQLLPSQPLPPEQLLELWEQGRPGDPFSTAHLAWHLVTEAGLRGRLVRCDSGRLLRSRSIAGVEVWDPSRRRWIFFDPWIGIGFNNPHAPLSLLQLRERLITGSWVSDFPFVEPSPESGGGLRAMEYSGRLRHVWYWKEQVDAEQPVKWTLMVDDRVSTWPYGLNSLPAPFSRFQASDSPSPSRRVFRQLSFLIGLLYLLLLLWHPGEGNYIAARLAGDLGRLIAGPGRFLRLVRAAGAKGFRSSLGTLAHRVAGSVDPQRGRWIQISRRPMVLRHRRLPVTLVLAAAGGAIFLSTIFLMVPECVEDAYITFRYARNMAHGAGPTFNATEPAVEGFSNMLWMLFLSVAFRFWGDLPTLASALGAAIGLGVLCVVAWTATRIGDRPWLPVFILATSCSFAGSCTSGLETGLVVMITTLIALSWALEGEGPWGLVRTSVACWLLTMARAEGWWLFLCISAVRIFEIRPGQTRSLPRFWFLPFLLLFGGYTAWRVSVFHQLVPHVYGVRLILQRGGLLERLAPGLIYVLSGLLAIPAGMAAVCLIPRLPWNRFSMRIVLVTFMHFTLIVLVGGDALYIRDSRFLMPVLPLLALIAQMVCLEPPGAGPSRRLIRGGLVAASVAGALMYLPFPQSSPMPKASPLVSWIPFGLSELNERLTHIKRHLKRSGADTSTYSFDGLVGRHLLDTLRPYESLACSQAGQIAYFWPGRFRDYFGLATEPIRPAPFAPPPGDRPRRYLLLPDHMNRALDPLREAGYRLSRVYVQLAPSHAFDWSHYALAAFPPEGGEPLEDSLLQAGRRGIAWWKLSWRRVVLFVGQGDELPLIDGPSGAIRIQRLKLLPRETRESLAQVWPWLPVELN